jgi:thioredoxin reductase (NADPH)
MQFDPAIAIYGAVLCSIWAAYTVVSRRREGRSLAIKTAAIEAGLTEPQTLHPVIDTAICVGCGTCAKACPEGNVLGLIDGRAELVAPTHCIGHGECAKACPTGAITLVFGTAKRGVELPQVGPDFQTNVPGVFIAGELGGMGLIRNAVEQGRQAVESIRKLPGHGRPGMHDLVIVGAGPAGIAAALTAKSCGLRYVVVEQDDLGGAVFKYPRGKVVMTAPVVLPLVGPVKFRETTKEALLEFWRGIEKRHQLAIRYRERVEAVARDPQSFVVTTSRGELRANAVLLTIGRRGTPRTLGVAGEALAKVVYQLIDAEQYRGRRVLVVGGGDSALEAAARLAEEPGTAVTLSYRSPHFSRARMANRERVEQHAKAGRIRLLMPSTVTRIAEHAVEIEAGGARIALPNDAVIVCAGGIMPSEFLRQAGIAMETKYGTA